MVVSGSLCSQVKKAVGQSRGMALYEDNVRRSHSSAPKAFRRTPSVSGEYRVTIGNVADITYSPVPVFRKH